MERLQHLLLANLKIKITLVISSFSYKLLVISDIYSIKMATARYFELLHQTTQRHVIARYLHDFTKAYEPKKNLLIYSNWIQNYNIK